MSDGLLGLLRGVRLPRGFPLAVGCGLASLIKRSGFVGRGHRRRCANPCRHERSIPSPRAPSVTASVAKRRWTGYREAAPFRPPRASMASLASWTGYS